MKDLCIGAGILFFAGVLTCYAVTPPRYLETKDFKQCLNVQDFGSWQGWCLPADKPVGCPAASWEQLNMETGKDCVPRCPAPLHSAGNSEDM